MENHTSNPNEMKDRRSKIISVDPGNTTNRTVVTLRTPEEVCEAAFHVLKKHKCSLI